MMVTLLSIALAILLVIGIAILMSTSGTTPRGLETPKATEALELDSDKIFSLRTGAYGEHGHIAFYMIRAP